MRLEEARVIRNEPMGGGYRLLELGAPGIGPEVAPGQFVHLRVGLRKDLVLRRPFSVFKADAKGLSILYKSVGQGTEAMTAIPTGGTVSLIGPLGRGYPAPTEGHAPVLVAGGYGMAALFLVAERSPLKGLAFFGGAATGDILCVEDFEKLGWDVRVATEDGSRGKRGLVTDALDEWLKGSSRPRNPEFFVCGPLGMLRAVGERAAAGGWKAWISMDRNMGCGVGACLACVQRIRNTDGSWSWARVCREGPVFECRDIVWNEE